MAQQYPPSAPPPPAGAPAQNGMALAAMICGILGIVVAILIPIGGFVLGIVGLILGLVSKQKATVTGIGLGQANAGVWTGAGAIAASIIAFFVYASILT